MAAAITKNPAFKEELTATLLQTLRQHPRASLAVPQGMADHKDNPQDIAAVTESAAYSQCIAELTDWLGTAKIALQVLSDSSLLCLPKLPLMFNKSSMAGVAHENRGRKAGLFTNGASSLGQAHMFFLLHTQRHPLCTLTGPCPSKAKQGCLQTSCSAKALVCI